MDTASLPSCIQKDISYTEKDISYTEKDISDVQRGIFNEYWVSSNALCVYKYRRITGNHTILLDPSHYIVRAYTTDPLARFELRIGNEISPVFYPENDAKNMRSIAALHNLPIHLAEHIPISLHIHTVSPEPQTLCLVYASLTNHKMHRITTKCDDFYIRWSCPPTFPLRPAEETIDTRDLMRSKLLDNATKVTSPLPTLTSLFGPLTRDGPIGFNSLIEP